MDFFSKRSNAFQFAISGFFQAVKQESHLKIHLLAAFAAIMAGFLFNINSNEWLSVCTAITLVISLELLNTSLEKLCDRLVPEQDPKIKYIKDVAAASVLVACIFALAVAWIVFLPHFF